MNCHDPSTTEKNYIDVISAKTAKLFSAATQVSAVLSAQPPTIEEAIADYGMHLGIAFQLVDDWLDFVSSAELLGNKLYIA